MSQTPEKTEKDTTKTKGDPKRAAYSKATTRLRDEHRDEFNNLLKEEMKAAGIEWEPRPTEAQKAEKEISDLLSKFPELKKKFDQEQDDPQEQDA